jgi:hypothetical protein
MNLDLIDLAVGALNHFKLSHTCRITMVTIAPRAFHKDGPVRAWNVRSDQMAPMIEGLRKKAHEALTEPTMSTGAWCRKCRAIATCSAARKASIQAVNYADQAYAIDSMTGAQISTEYRMLLQSRKVLDDRIGALEDEIRHRLEEGDEGIDYQLEEGSSKWVWDTEDTQTVIDVAKQFGVEARKESTLTVAQVRSAMPSAQRKHFDLIRPTLARVKRGKKVLVHTSDSVAHKVFGRFEQ